MTNNFVEIKNLTKYYKNILGVKDLNLELKKGEIFGFIGPNGAGKSTTIKCIMNLINKDCGQILINGEEIKGNNFKIKDIIGYLPSEINLYEEMTVKEIMDYSMSFYNKNLKKRSEYLLKKFELDKNKKIETLSFGNIKKMGIVLSLLHNPELLILDEPTSGLDPLMQEVFFEVLEEEKKKGVTIFFSSHNLNEVKRICDRVGIIKNGKLIEIEEISNLSKSNFMIITVDSKEYKKLKIPVKDIKIKEKNENKIKFIYTGNINDLIKYLAEINIKELLIENPSLEEIFMHYYKED